MHRVTGVTTSLSPGTFLVNGALCGNGNSLCFSNTECLLKVYDARRLSYLRDVTGHVDQVTDMCCLGDTLFTSQRDTGVMMTDLRQQQPAHFLSELRGTGQECHSIDINPVDGTTLAVAVGGSIQLVDTRVWRTAKALDAVHSDDITRLRWFGQDRLCSGGEDHMVNFFDTAAAHDKDILLSSGYTGECANKMAAVPDRHCVAVTGSCENAFLFPTMVDPEGAYLNEVKLPRGDFSVYIVDWVCLDGALVLVSGRHPEEFDDATPEDAPDAVAPLTATPFPTPWSGHATAPAALELPPVHRGVVRAAVGVDAATMVTAGEDGVITAWRTGAAPDDASSASSHKERPEHKMASRGRPYMKR